MHGTEETMVRAQLLFLTKMENKDWIDGSKFANDRKWEEALHAFERAMEQIADNPDLIHDRAVAMFNLGRKEEALSELDRAVVLQPDYSYRYSSRAYMRSALKDIHGAIEDYKKAIELDPEDAIAHNNLGMLEEQLGYTKEARDRYSVADELKGILKDAQIDSEAPPKKTPPKVEPIKDEAAYLKKLQEQGSPVSSERPLSPKKPIVIQPAEKAGGIFTEALAVFTDKRRRGEFFRFIRNGFKLDQSNSDDREDLSQ